MNTTIFLVKAHIANTMRLEEGVNCKRIRRADDGEGFVVEGMPEVPTGKKVTIPWANIGTAIEDAGPVPAPQPPSPTNSLTAPPSKTPKKPSRKTSKK